MKRVAWGISVVFFMVSWFSPAWSVPILYDWAFNVNGVIYTAPDIYSPPDTGQLPGYFDYSGFDWDTGLGTISIIYNPGAADDYYFLSFFDHDVDGDTNTFLNEYGNPEGIAEDKPLAYQSWEIDEPGYSFGDIYSNVLSGTLDNYNEVPDGLSDDVSMALGWEFTLDEGQYAIISFILTQNLIGFDGFYLSQIDAESQEAIYFYSTLDIQSDDTPLPVPEPSTMLLLGSGLVGLVSLRKRMTR